MKGVEMKRLLSGHSFEEMLLWLAFLANMVWLISEPTSLEGLTSAITLLAAIVAFRER